jgi:AcrR family transcriptional regulator
MEERGDQILQTATRLFSERGYSATRLDDIATELGVTRAALYYYFPRGKVEILELVCAAGMDGAETVFRDAERVTDPLEAVRTFFGTYAVHITSGEARVFFRETSELDPQFRRSLLRRARSLTAGVISLLQRGIDDGLFRDDFDPELAANGVLGSLNWMSQWYQGNRRGWAADAVGEQFGELFLEGVVRNGRVSSP